MSSPSITPHDIAQLASIRHRDPALALSIAEQSGKEHDRTFLASGAPRITIKETKP